jgi:hypothetical protein
VQYYAGRWFLRVRAATISLWTRQDALDILKVLGKRKEAAFEKSYKKREAKRRCRLEKEAERHRREVEKSNEQALQTLENDPSADSQRDESAV